MVVIIPLSKRGKNAGKYQAIVDDEFAHMANFNWTAIPMHNREVYVHRQIYNGKDAKPKQTPLSLHRAIMQEHLGRALLRSEHIDHINGNPLDNRLSNLRIATCAQNVRNQKRSKSNKSGFKGVTASGKKWQANIKDGGKLRYIGLFDTPEEAHAAYCEAGKAAFGEFFRAA